MARDEDVATKLQVDDEGARLLIMGEGVFLKQSLPESARLTVIVATKIVTLVRRPRM